MTLESWLDLVYSTVCGALFSRSRSPTEAEKFFYIKRYEYRRPASDAEPNPAPIYMNTKWYVLYNTHRVAALFSILV